MTTPENVNVNKLEKPTESPMAHLEEALPGVAEIITDGDSKDLHATEDKYNVTKTPEDLTIGVKSMVVSIESLSRAFPGAIIVKTIAGPYFAVRKNGDGTWEGNSFTLMPNGSIGAVYQEHTIDTNLIEVVEKKLELTIPVLNRDLMKLGVNHEKRGEFLNDLKDFPPEERINLYHGLNGGIGSALKILESPEHGVKQISGPCLSVYPVGQFWKPGGAGFKYSILRGDIEFPGESRPDAQFRMNDEGTIFLINGLDTLSLTRFDGEVMRTVATKDVYEKNEDGSNKGEYVNGEWVVLPPTETAILLTNEEMALEKKIQEEVKKFSDIRTSMPD